MHRAFITSQNRKLTYLDGYWDFVPDPDDRGTTDAWYNRFPDKGTRLWVPGVWNTCRCFSDYEGIGWYRKRIQLNACPAAVLNFAAVTHQANVWLDGEPLGDHYGSFLPFSFMIENPTPGSHELVVRVDNRHNMQDTIPSAKLDWFRYGGIFRPVWIEELSGPGHIASLRLSPVVNDEHAALNVRMELTNLSDQPLVDRWEVHLGEKLLRSDKLRLAPRSSKAVLFGATLQDVEMWSPSRPVLYSVRACFAGDDLCERTGFREITIDQTRVLINGEPLSIRGVNRHEDHPDWGFALPEHLMLRDLELLRDLGCNAIRCSHYPNDQRILDLCDELGILVMEEIPLWGFQEEQLCHELVIDRAAAMTWAMVERDISHPCIWAWSVLNECATDIPIGRAVVSQLVDAVRDLDATRPVTFASNRGLTDICFDLVDIVSVNAYYGWYRHDLTWPEFLDRVRARIGQKPLLVSEFGAGAIYGYHALEPGVLWSEEYQKALLTDCITHFIRRPDLLGFYIWQFCDTRTDRQRALTRPRSYNNKGLLNEFRQPKLAYHAVRDLLTRSAGSP